MSNEILCLTPEFVQEHEADIIKRYNLYPKLLYAVVQAETAITIALQLSRITGGEAPEGSVLGILQEIIKEANK